jgi:hypothetical protein
MPLILGANSVTGGYEIDNSLRFNHGSSDELARTMGTATDGKKCTISFWIKKCRIEGSTTTVRFMQAYSGVGNQFHSQWGDGSTSPGDQWDISPGEQSGNAGIRMTNATYRDPSAWYHYLWYWDSVAQLSTLYVNGEAQSSSINDAVVLNQITSATKSVTSFRIQSSFSGQAEFYLAEFYIIDGQALDPTNFGEFDEDSGIWKPIAYEGTFGNNGCYLEFKDSSALGDDTSGNGNDFTVYNLTSIDQTTDTPTNNFATMNPLDKNSTTFSEGNLKLNWSQSAGTFGLTTGTIGMTAGKWYWEAKITSADNSTGIGLGVIETEPYLSRETATGVDPSLFYGLGARFTTAKAVNQTSNNVDTSISDTWSNDDIIRIAYDGDAGKIYMWKDATELNGQTFSTSTSFNGATLTAETLVLPFVSLGDGGSGTKTSQVEFNFGGAQSFTISSGNADANGYGNFEYAVPAGYYALCTANLAEFG